MPKRKSAPVRLSHCSTCHQPLDVGADHIDWHAVYVSARVFAHMVDTGRIPTQEELSDMDKTTGSDPCDDCCCGSCGQRKGEPGEVHC